MFPEEVPHVAYRPGFSGEALFIAFQETDLPMATRTKTADSPAPPRLLTKQEVAKYLHISTRTIDRLRSLQAFPPPIVVGGALGSTPGRAHTRWRLPDIEKWLDGQTAQGGK